MKQSLVSTIIDKNEIPDTRYCSDDGAWLHRISKDTFIEGINWMMFKQLGLKSLINVTLGVGEFRILSHTQKKVVKICFRLIT